MIPLIQIRPDSHFASNPFLPPCQVTSLQSITELSLVQVSFLIQIKIFYTFSPSSKGAVTTPANVVDMIEEGVMVGAGRSAGGGSGAQVYEAQDAVVMRSGAETN